MRLRQSSGLTAMKMKPERVLPREMWAAILQCLTSQELCCMALVSRYFHAMVSCPHLWLRRAISMAKVRSVGIVSVFNIPRFQGIKSLDLSNSRLSSSHCNALFTHLLHHPDVKVQSVNLEGVNLSSVPASLLARCMARLCKVNLLETMLTTTQVTVLLKHIMSSISLVDLSLVCVNLSEVDAELLAKALTHIPRVDLSETGLEPAQCTSILSSITQSSRLKDLSLVCVDLSTIAETLLADAINLLHRADIADTELTTGQCNAIFNKSLTSSTLAHLNIASTDLSFTSPFYLSRAVGGFTSINLSDTQLSSNLCNRIMTSIVQSTSLQEVNMEGVDLSEVSVDLLSKAMSKLHRIDLSDTTLKTDQSVGLLTGCLSSLSVVDLTINGISLAGVPPSLLARTVAKLYRASLSETGLSVEQIIEILTMAVVSTSLTHLDLKYVNLTEVPDDLLQKATKKFHL